MSHTPGPWRVVEREVLEDGSVYPRYVVAGDDFPVCPLEAPSIAQLAHDNPGSFWGETSIGKANAALIAAAPDLYDALQRSLGCIRGLLARTPVRDVSETLAEIAAAIAKAEGK